MFPLNCSEEASKIIVAVKEIEKATRNQKRNTFFNEDLEIIFISFSIFYFFLTQKNTKVTKLPTK